MINCFSFIHVSVHEFQKIRKFSVYGITSRKSNGKKLILNQWICFLQTINIEIKKLYMADFWDLI